MSDLFDASGCLDPFNVQCDCPACREANESE